MTLTRRTLGFGLSVLLGTASLPALAQEAALPDAIRVGSTAPGHLKFILFRNLQLLEKEFEAEGKDHAKGSPESEGFFAKVAAFFEGRG